MSGGTDSIQTKTGKENLTLRTKVCTKPLRCRHVCEREKYCRELAKDIVTVCFELKPTSTFLLHVFLFFFFFQPAIVDFVNCEQCICILFTVPQITLFSNFFIKNESHNTIYTFKNYLATLFSVSAKISSFQTHSICK